jgi:carbonic anhydrase
MVDALLRGHGEFQRRYVGDERAFLERLASAKQNPDAIFIGCSDSRVVPELLTTSTPGALFVVRNVANLIAPYEHPHVSVGAALEYAVGELHVPHVIVCGHYGCGGVRAVMDGASFTDRPALRSWLEGARPAVLATQEHAADPETWWRRAVERNVLQQLVHVTTYPVVIDALERDALRLHGWVYDLYSLELWAYDPVLDAFARAADVIGAPAEQH